MSEAIRLNDEPCEHRKTAQAAIASGEVQQMSNGRAAVYVGLNAAASGAQTGWTEEGRFTILKATSLVFVKGCEVYWDHSADRAVLHPASDRDFFIGTAEEDAAATATTCVVNLNVRASYKIDLLRGGIPDESLTVIVKTVVGSTTVEVPDLKMRPGCAKMIFGATAEAQKVDILSQQGFALGSNWVAEFGVNIIDDGDAAAIDFSVGVANATHASDADAIAESLFIHTDGDNVNLNAESDDGTNENAATDTTLDYTLATPFHIVLDGRVPAACLVYINGVRVNDGTTGAALTFNLSSATGPLKLLAHLEKTADDTTADYRILYARVRTMQDD